MDYSPNTAFLIIDMLNDFVLEGAPLEVPAARDIIPEIAHEAGKARAPGAHVIYVCDTHDPDDAEFKTWPRHAVRGTPGAQVVRELAPQPNDKVIAKTRYSGFFRTELDAALRELRAEQLVLTGILTEICVFFTAADAYMRGYPVALLEKCVTSLTQDDHTHALEQMKRLFEAKIV